MFHYRNFGLNTLNQTWDKLCHDVRGEDLKKNLRHGHQKLSLGVDGGLSSNQFKFCVRQGF